MRIKGQSHLSCKELLHSRFSIGRSVWNISGSRQDLVENITIHSSRHCKELFGFLVGGLALAVGAALVDDLLKHQSIFAKASFITTEVRWNWITAGIKTCSSIRCSCRSQARTSPCKCSRAIAPVIIIRSDITRSVELRVNSPRLLGIPQDLSWSQGSNLKRGSRGAVLELVKSVQVEVGKVHGRKALTKAKAQILGSQRSMNLVDADWKDAASELEHACGQPCHQGLLVVSLA